MKVKELIKQLQECNPDLDVYGYNSLYEGGGEVWEAKETIREFPYCQANSAKPKDGNAYVLILVE